MREVSAKLVGSVVLVIGAVTALAAGVLLPVLGGFGSSWFSAGVPAVGEAPRAVDTAAASGTPPQGHARATTPALRLRPIQVSGAVVAAAKAPSDVDMVLVVEHAAALRDSRIGDAAVRFFVDAAGMTQTRQAWAELAAKLGWSQTELFDRLLGGRVVLVARGFGDVQTARWAIMSDISVETDQRLKEKLEASQRSIDNGHQILSIEKGRYELTSHRHARVRGGGDEVTIILGPAGRSELFDEMVGVLARGAADPLEKHDVIAAAGKAGSPEILMLARLDSTKPGDTIAAAPPPGDDRWSDFFVLSGGRRQQADGSIRADGSEFVARVVYRDRRERESNLSIKPTSDTVFRALQPGSLLTIVQAAPVQQILGERAQFLDALRDLPLPESAERLLAPRQVVALRESPATGSVAVPGKAPETHVSAVLALETTSASKLAPILDGSIARFIKEREQQFGIVRPPPFDFGGRLPGVTRVLPLAVPEGNPLRLFVPDPLTLAWSFPTIGEPAATGGDSGDPGWWVMSISPSPPGLEILPEEVHNTVARALAAGEPANSAVSGRRWIWLGSLHPAAVESRLPSAAILPDLGGFRSAMKRFDDLTIELSISDEGDVQGDLVAKLAETRVK